MITRNGDYGSESSCWDQTGGKGNQIKQTVVITQAQPSRAFPALPLPSLDTAFTAVLQGREGAIRSLILKMMEQQTKAVKWLSQCHTDNCNLGTGNRAL